jgi:galactokinase
LSDDLPSSMLANICMKAEWYVGTAGGGMDQAAILLSQEGFATHIEFNQPTLQPLLPSAFPLESPSSSRTLSLAGVPRRKRLPPLNLRNAFSSAALEREYLQTSNDKSRSPKFFRPAQAARAPRRYLP